MRFRRAINYSDYGSKLTVNTDYWALLDEFARDWQLDDGKAWSTETSASIEAEFAEAERRLDISLPLALKRWHLLSTRLPRYWRICLTYAMPLQCLEPADGVLVFHTEHQDCCQWSFRVEDAHLPDPPVYIGMDFEDGRIDWFFQNERLSQFCLQRVMTDVLGSGILVGANSFYSAHTVNPPEELIYRFNQLLPPLGIPKQLWFNATLHGGLDLIADVWEPFLDEKDYLISLTARSRIGLFKALEALGGEWKCQSEGTIRSADLIKKPRRLGVRRV